MSAACSAYIPGSLCRNGFPMGYPVSSACTGNKCLGCGRFNEVVPACQDEDIHPRWIDDAGRPKFAFQEPKP